MTEAEQMAVYQLQVMGVRAEVIQRFATIALIVVVCVALVFAMVALFTYIKKCRAEMQAMEVVEQQEVVDTSYTTLNLDGTDTVQDMTDEPAENFDNSQQ